MPQTRLSSLIENALEYRFLAELAGTLLRRGHPYEVLRSDVDRTGHDLIVEANGHMRHIQLKAMIAGGKRADVTVNVALAAKPAGCVIWMVYDPVSLALLEYRWFGGAAGEPLPLLGERIAKHSKANADGEKLERPAHRVVPVRRFEAVRTASALVERLFDIPDPDRLLAGYLAAATEALPAARDWESSCDLAHLIDGYALLDALGHHDPDAWLARRNESARRSGHWPGTAAELWITLFLEHRRWRFAGVDPDPATEAMLDRLVRQLRALLPGLTRPFPS